MSHESLQDHWPLGVFASIDAGFGVHLDVAQSLQVPTMHLHAPHKEQRTPLLAEKFLAHIKSIGMKVTVVFAGFDGESYDSIPVVKTSVGLVPLKTRESRLIELREIIDFTSMLDVDATGLHIGFVPHDSSDPEYASLVEATQSVCDYAEKLKVNIHLETGQESADVLLAFLSAVDRSNLYVNFDPANMILYGCGEPLPALEKLGSHVRSVHCKDAKWSDKPGETWGEETALGKGDVDFPAYFEMLAKIGYQGPLTIEREISQEPERQKNEIEAAVNELNRLKQSKVNGIQ